ncbi:DUF2064 domain-containing protein [Halomonas smyrnensis]|uniref:DUF2064 domain-containing protein n=1 Tax=Halomonas smyrnensis TaxID=720605 RepID=UPI0002D51300|nr:DUF2064 domain-containing protein [Halomonas smyrnensis]
MSTPPRLSIVLPTLNEAAIIEATLTRLQAMKAGGVELLVVDGGSRDETPARARPLATRVIASAPGRARQMNAGAAEARGRTLLFLHADTDLPPGAEAAIAAALTPALLRRCTAALTEADGVCVPVEDGGYALVGARRADPGLFQGVDWGTDRVMAQTRERAMAMGWRLACPARLWDVDRPEDLPRLARLGEALGVDFLAPRHRGRRDSRPAL